LYRMYNKTIGNRYFCSVFIKRGKIIYLDDISQHCVFNVEVY